MICRYVKTVICDVNRGITGEIKHWLREGLTLGEKVGLGSGPSEDGCLVPKWATNTHPKVSTSGGCLVGK